MGRSKWTLDVKSTAEAIHAIDINTRGALGRYLRGPARDRMYRIALQKRENVIDPKEATNRSGRSTIYIMPTIRGKNSGTAKIIAGVALIALTWGAAAGYLGPLLGNFVGAGALGGAGTLTAAGSFIVGFGISMILGGIAQLLTPTPQGASASPDQAQSTSFQGNATTVTQGGCIPIVYGRALVAPVPVSITISNNDVSTSAAGTVGTVVTTPLDGGGNQNEPGGTP